MDGIYSPTGMIGKEEVWKKYGYLVRHEALKLQARLPEAVELDDLIQAGAIAMLAATEQFDPQKGVQFIAFLARKIRWAFMDELREQDWVPRRVRRNSREVSSAISRVEQRSGQTASEQDIADEMGISLQSYQQILAETNTSMICSLDELQLDLAEGMELAELQEEHLDPANSARLNELMQKISQAIKELPEREQILLSLYYQDDLNMKEIGTLLGVTETRVSQLHSQAIKRLRARLELTGLDVDSL